jgi:hypothetical protein
MTVVAKADIPSNSLNNRFLPNHLIPSVTQESVLKLRKYDAGRPGNARNLPPKRALVAQPHPAASPGILLADQIDQRAQVEGQVSPARII